MSKTLILLVENLDKCLLDVGERKNYLNKTSTLNSPPPPKKLTIKNHYIKFKKFCPLKEHLTKK